MSTLSPEDVSFHEECRESELTESDLIAATNNALSKNAANDVVECREQLRKRKLDKTGAENAEEQPEEVLSVSSKTRRRIAEQTTLSNTDSLFQFDASVSQRTRSRTNTTAISQNKTKKRRKRDQTEEEQTTHSHLISVEEPRNVPTIVEPDDVARTPEPTQNKAKPSEVNVTFFDTEETEQPLLMRESEALSNNTHLNDYIPQSPPRPQDTQIRTIFSRCFEKTCIPKEPSPDSQIYAANSDNEYAESQ